MSIWPASYHGAISLTFDDGMDSQLNFAISEMDSRRLKGTFYLNPRDAAVQDSIISWERVLLRWLPHQMNGHEIGNHTVHHPCSLNANLDWQRGNNLLDWDIERIEADILEAQNRIQHVFRAQTANSFAYPCYESTVGRGPSRKSYTPIIAKYFPGARAKGELRGDLANDPLYCDLHHLSSWPVERSTGAFMIGLVEQAARRGLWGIFTFHGIHEGHLPVGSTDFVELLDHLDYRKKDIWIAPLAEIAVYLQGVQKNS
jgi:peptidoglycan-N-acetylglucosamine deacetylase